MPGFNPDTNRIISGISEFHGVHWSKVEFYQENRDKVPEEELKKLEAIGYVPPKPKPAPPITPLTGEEQRPAELTPEGKVVAKEEAPVEEAPAAPEAPSEEPVSAADALKEATA